MTFLQSKFSEKELLYIATDPALNLAHSLTHDEFLRGIKNNSIECFLLGNASDFLSGIYKKIFNIVVILYMAGPLIIVPIGCYFLDNWWYLLGILFSYFGTFLGIKKSKIPIYLLLLLIGASFTGKVHLVGYETIFYTCIMWGNLWYLIANQVETDYAIYALIDKPELYELAINKNRIIVSKK